MKALFCAGFVALATIAITAQESKLGSGVSLKDATPIKALVNHPEAFVGKTVRIDGVATAVCEHMGCWLSISTSEAKDAETIRVKVDDGAIVFPVTARGRQVSAEGVFEAVPAENAHAAHEATAKHEASGKHEAAGTHYAGAHDAGHAAKKYQIKATGAVVR